MTTEYFPHPLDVHNYLIDVRASGTYDLYMESGVLDHKNIAPLNENTYIPSELHYGSDVNAVRGPNASLGGLTVKPGAASPIEGENRDEGDSEAVGCSPKAKQITVTTDFDTKTFISGTPAYCPSLMSEKRAQSLMPASKFSGKLRLMVQAIYGSKRDDYSIDPVLEGLGPLTVGVVNLNWTYNGNSALFSGRNYEYFLLSILSSGVWAIPIVPSEPGKELRNYLIDNPGLSGALKRQYETYLLSTLYVKRDSNWVQVTDDSGDAYKHGTPWYYGWSWNMSGTEARAVTITKKDDPAEPKIWEATVFGLTVSESAFLGTLEEGRLSASFSTIEATQEFSFGLNEDMVWYPDDLSGGMRPFIPHEPFDGGPTAGDIDVPMYVIYDYANDKFDTIRFERSDLGSGEDVLGGTDSWSGGVNNNLPHCDGDHACRWITKASSASEKGFFVKDYTQWTGVAKTGENAELIGYECWLEGGRIPDPGLIGGIVLCDGTNKPNNAGGIAYQGAGGDLRVNGSLVLQTLLVVPYGDCDSAYLGAWSSFNGNIKSRKLTSEARVLVEWDVGGGTIKKHRWVWFSPSGKARPHDWSLSTRAAKKGHFTGIDEPGSWNLMDIHHYSNGTDTAVYSERHVSSESLGSSLFIPACAKGIALSLESFNLPNWNAGDLNLGGYKKFFDPVLFPEPQIMPAVTAKASANFHSFKAKKNPGSETWVDDGTYDYENIDDNLFSYVGFA